MKRIALVLAAGVAAITWTAQPAYTHDANPEYSGCGSRGGHLAGAMTGQVGHANDRNGDGVVCMYFDSKGGIRFADNHLHRR